ncbi:MAG: DEAD/DEAH box helicase, partial [Clostridiales bacterium]|nr:DEAD/DEAH box helicase [Clostridiales bacterium]
MQIDRDADHTVRNDIDHTVGNDIDYAKYNDFLEIPIEKCLRITPKRLELIRRLGIYRVYDLVSFFPKNYEDWTGRMPISDLQDGSDATFCALVRQKPSLFRKGRFSVLQTVVEDESGVIRAVWFNQPYYQNKLIRGYTYLFRGKIKRDGKVFEVVNPMFKEEDSVEIPVIRPVYPMTKGLKQHVLRSMIEQVLPKALPELPEPIPDFIRKRERLCSAPYAYEKIHFPETMEMMEESKKRLVYEELFMIIGGLKAIKRQKASSGSAVEIRPNNEAKKRLKRFIDTFPFRLTEDQKKVLSEVAKDISSKRPMNRLVQGDVGSGKTAVAASAMCLSAVCGHQSIFMAPTSVLATQHYQNLKEMFSNVGIKTDLMLGSSSASEKRRIRERLLIGETQILIGTHAVLSEKNEYRSLALLITDEQHRFGVRQRGALSTDASRDLHTLVMSATPIPRTLAMILYGDLDISVIKSIPSGRMPIETYMANSDENERIYAIMCRQIESGRQVYYVCPQIESDEEADDGIATVTEQYDRFKKTDFHRYRVALLH